MGVLATALSYGPPVLRDADVDASLVPELQAAIEDQRSLIQIVPGEGDVLGVWVFNGDVYAFRNKSGGVTAGMHESTPTGWAEVDLGTALNFDSTVTAGEPVPGDVGTATTIKGSTSGAQGDLMGISYHGLWSQGAAGTMVLTNVTGTFQNNEPLKMPLLTFDTGNIEFSAGDSIVGGSSGKTATVTSVTLTGGSWDGSAAGYISVKNNSGTWTNSEQIQVNGTNYALVNGASEPNEVAVAEASGTLYAQTLSPGGKYEFSTYNFRGDTSGITMYGANTVDAGFSFDGTTFIKIQTGMENNVPQHIATHQKHLFFSFANGSIQHSSIAAPNKWSAVTGAAELGIGGRG